MLSCVCSAQASSSFEKLCMPVHSFIKCSRGEFLCAVLSSLHHLLRLTNRNQPPRSAAIISIKHDFLQKQQVLEGTSRDMSRSRSQILKTLPPWDPLQRLDSSLTLLYLQRFSTIVPHPQTHYESITDSMPLYNGTTNFKLLKLLFVRGDLCIERVRATLLQIRHIYLISESHCQSNSKPTR